MEDCTFLWKIPCSLHQYVATMKISSIGLIFHVTHETSINSERLQNQSIFSFFSLTPGDDCLKKVFRAKLCHFLHFCCYIQKQYTNQAPCKKKKLSLCLFVFVRDGNPEMMSQSKVDPLSCIVIHGPKKAPNFLTLKRYNIWRKNTGPKHFFQSNKGRS